MVNVNLVVSPVAIYKYKMPRKQAQKLPVDKTAYILQSDRGENKFMTTKCSIDTDKHLTHKSYT